MQHISGAIIQWCADRNAKPDDLAAQARVGSAIVRRLISEELGPETVTGHSPRQQAGWARSISRLAHFLQLDPAETLKTIGLGTFTARESVPAAPKASPESQLNRLVHDLARLSIFASPGQAIRMLCAIIRQVSASDSITAYSWNRRLNRSITVWTEGLYCQEIDYTRCGPGDLLHRLLLISPAGTVLHEPQADQATSSGKISFCACEHVVAWYALTFRWGNAPLCIFLNYQDVTSFPTIEAVEQIAIYVSGYITRLAQGDTFNDAALDSYAVSNLKSSWRTSVAFVDELVSNGRGISMNSPAPSIADRPQLDEREMDGLERTLYKAFEGEGRPSLGISVHPTVGSQEQLRLLCRGTSTRAISVSINVNDSVDRFVDMGIGAQAAAWGTTLTVFDLDTQVHQKDNKRSWRQLQRGWNPRSARDAQSLLAIPITSGNRVLGVVEISYFDRRMAGLADSILAEAICDAFAEIKSVFPTDRAVAEPVKSCIRAMRARLEGNTDVLQSPDYFLSDLTNSILNDSRVGCDLVYVYLYDANFNQFLPYATAISDALTNQFLESVWPSSDQLSDRERMLVRSAINNLLPRDVLDRTWIAFRRGVPQWVSNVDTAVTAGSKVSRFSKKFIRSALAIPFGGGRASSPSGVLWCKWSKDNTADSGNSTGDCDAHFSAIVDRWIPAIRMAASLHALGTISAVIRPEVESVRQPFRDGISK